jgi:hypothetical protein
LQYLINRPTRTIALTVVAAWPAIGSATPSQADVGYVRAVVTKGGFIIGVGGGTGTLVFRGHHYPLEISGMSFGATIGASTSDLRGHAYHMHSPGDIEGTYSTIGAGAAIAGGAGGLRLQNASCVVLELSGVKVGAELSGRRRRRASQAAPIASSTGTGMRRGTFAAARSVCATSRNKGRRGLPESGGQRRTCGLDHM